MRKRILIFLFLMAFAPPLAGQGLVFAAGNPINDGDGWDTLEIVTYYPSPYGYYEELRGDKIIVGDSDNSYVNETDLPPTGTITFDGLPSAPTGKLYESTMYYDTSEHKFKYYYNSAWQDLGGGGAYWDILTGNDIYNTNSGNVKISGNVGIGVSASDTIGAKLTLKSDISPVSMGTTYSFPYSSSRYSWRVPDGVSSLTITAYGANPASWCCGSMACAGKGAIVTATISVTPRETLYIYTGGKDGTNGGGAAISGLSAGGGATDIRQGGSGANNRVIVAGGGGGMGQSPTGSGSVGVKGGDAGASGDGACYGSDCTGGGAGTISAGGTRGYWTGQAGDSTGIGKGGAANEDTRSGSRYVGGGGGGGYHGGGSGSNNPNVGGGGGGSNLVPAGGTSSIRPGSGSCNLSDFAGSDGMVTIVVSGIGSLPNFMEWKNSSGDVLTAFDAQGNLALGASSANGSKLYVNGSAYTTGNIWATSDLRFKENVLPLNNSLDRILSIQPVSFDWNKSGYPDMNFEPSRQIGLVAQEVEKQIPELVRTDTKGYKSVAYDKLTAVLVEAMKEQQAQIKAQGERMRDQQKEIELLELRLEELNHKK